MTIEIRFVHFKSLSVIFHCFNGFMLTALLILEHQLTILIAVEQQDQKNRGQIKNQYFTPKTNK